MSSRPVRRGTLRLDAVRATAQQLQSKDGGLRVPEDADTSKFYPNRIPYDEYDRKVLKDFFNSDGSLRQLPMQRKKFLVRLRTTRSQSKRTLT
jgi:hypothetical protein